MNKDVYSILSQPSCSPDELCRVLDLSRNSVYEALERGDFLSFRVGRRYRIPTAPLRRMLGITLGLDFGNAIEFLNDGHEAVRGDLPKSKPAVTDGDARSTAAAPRSAQT
jgi:excisionase family DNA binding protein